MLTREAPRILIVDDSERDFRATRELLLRSRLRCSVITRAGTYADGLAGLVDGACDVGLVDYDLDSRHGCELVAEAHQRGARAPMILLSGHDLFMAHTSAHVAGLADCLPKWHLTPALLERSIHYALERRALLARARLLEERWSRFADHSRVIFFEGDPWTQRLLYVSPAYEAILGQSCAEACAVPRAWLASVHEDDHAAVTASCRESPTEEIEFRIVRADGEVRWLRRRASAVRDEDGRVVRVVGTAEDVTLLRDARRQAAVSNRMETMGRLVGCVAHDCNNMLTAIICEAEAMRNALAHGDPVHAAAVEIIGSSNRAASLTRQLLRYGSEGACELQLVDVNDLVEGIQRMLQRLAGASIRVIVELVSDPGLVIADGAQLEQVLVNLVLNARDAMPGGGRVVIGTRNKRVEGEGAGAVAEGDYVVLSVTDEGTGMNGHVITRIFEPYFTTKEPDRGTGLGLASVREIVERFGGGVVVRSEMGVGSTFEAYVPKAR